MRCGEFHHPDVFHPSGIKGGWVRRGFMFFVVTERVNLPVYLLIGDLSSHIYFVLCSVLSPTWKQVLDVSFYFYLSGLRRISFGML